MATIEQRSIFDTAMRILTEAARYQFSVELSPKQAMAICEYITVVQRKMAGIVEPEPVCTDNVRSIAGRKVFRSEFSKDLDPDPAA